MNVESGSESLSSRIGALYHGGLVAYREYLEDDLSPHAYHREIREVGHGGSGQFYSIVSENVRRSGVELRINYLNNEYPDQATVSYPNDSARQQALAVSTDHWNFKHFELRHVMRDYSGATAVAAVALRADVAIYEITERYTHFTLSDLRRLEQEYMFATKLHCQDPDLFFRLILEHNLHEYVMRSSLEWMATTQYIDEGSSSTDLPPAAANTEMDQARTRDMSEAEYLHMPYRLVEDLVLQGYSPLLPNEYERCVAKVLSRY